LTVIRDSSTVRASGGDVGVESFAAARTEPDVIGLHFFTEFVGYRSGKEIHFDLPDPAQVLYLPLELEVFGYWLVTSSVQRFPDLSGLIRVGDHFRLEEDIQILGGPGSWKVRYERPRTAAPDQLGPQQQTVATAHDKRYVTRL
jgi:hypothetical protein